MHSLQLQVQKLTVVQYFFCTPSEYAVKVSKILPDRKFVQKTSKIR
jgi:hypothetical protein